MSQTLDQFVLELKKVSVQIPATIRVSSWEEAENLKEALKIRSPVDSGRFRSAWVVSGGGSSQRNITSIKIQNRVLYAQYIEEGGMPGGVPWTFPNEKNPGPVSASGKLVYAQGRVWPGGLSPYGFNIGGVSSNVLTDKYVDSMVDRLANRVFSEFSGSK